MGLDKGALILRVQIELKLKYKFRLILDETWSFGVLGNFPTACFRPTRFTRGFCA